MRHVALWVLGALLAGVVASYPTRGRARRVVATVSVTLALLFAAAGMKAGWTTQSVLLLLVNAGGWMAVVGAQDVFESLLPGLLVVDGLLSAALVSPSPLLLWACLEAQTLVAAGLMSGSRQGTEAAWKFGIVLLASGLLALLGTVLVLQAAPHFQVFGSRGALPRVGAVTLGLLAMIVGYGAKLGLAPLLLWVPDAYGASPAPLAAILASGEATAAAGVVYRLLLQLPAGDSSAWGLLMVLGAAGAVYGALGVLVTHHRPRMLGYLALQHMGLAVMALATGTPFGLLAGFAQIAMQPMAKAPAFLFLGDGHRGGGRHGWSLMSLLAVAGLPPFGLFWSELMVLVALVRAGMALAAGLGAFAVGLSVIAVLRRLARQVEGAEEPVSLGRATVVAGAAGAVASLLAGAALLPLEVQHVWVALLR